ncbi:MAG: hypothetical protein M0R16_10350 [Bacteroidales bacterium]|nr:hypothetical protein [Bacteroidales bacterium]
MRKEPPDCCGPALSAVEGAATERWHENMAVSASGMRRRFAIYFLDFLGTFVSRQKYHIKKTKPLISATGRNLSSTNQNTVTKSTS